MPYSRSCVALPAAVLQRLQAAGVPAAAACRVVSDTKVRLQQALAIPMKRADHPLIGLLMRSEDLGYPNSPDNPTSAGRRLPRDVDSVLVRRWHLSLGATAEDGFLPSNRRREITHAMPRNGCISPSPKQGNIFPLSRPASRADLDIGVGEAAVGRCNSSRLVRHGSSSDDSRNRARIVHRVIGSLIRPFSVQAIRLRPVEAIQAQRSL